MKNKYFVGSSFVAISALMFALSGMLSRFVNDSFAIFLQHSLRCLIALAVLVPLGIVLKQYKKIEKKDKKTFFVVSLCGMLCAICVYRAFVLLPIAEASLIVFSMIVISNLFFGTILFKEKFTVIKTASTVLALLGIFVVFFGDFNSSVSGKIVAVLGGLFVGIETSYSKKITPKYSLIQCVTGVFALGFVAAFIIHLFLNGFKIDLAASGGGYAYLIAIAIVSLLGTTSEYFGYKKIETGIAGIISILEIPFSVVLALIIFKEAITIKIFMGMLCVISAALLPNLYEVFENKNIKK